MCFALVLGCSGLGCSGTSGSAPGPGPSSGPGGSATGSDSATGSSSAGGGSGPATGCRTSDCGPRLGMPSQQCADGSIGGNTGRCIRLADGSCGWEIRECPASLEAP